MGFPGGAICWLRRGWLVGWLATAGLVFALLPIHASAASSPTPAPQGTGQHLTVTPDHGLKDGQTVSVHATGFGPNETLAVAECANKVDTGEGDCDVANVDLVNSDAHGVVDAKKKVFDGRTKAFGINSINCREFPTGCQLTVSQVSLTPAEQARAPISFASLAVGAPAPTIVPWSFGLLPDVGLGLLPAALTALWLVSRWRRRPEAPTVLWYAKVSAGLLLILTLLAQAYFVAGPMLAAHDLSVPGAVVFAINLLGADIVWGLMFLLIAMARRRPQSGAWVAGLGVLMGFVLIPLAAALWYAVTVVAHAPLDSGGGTIWLGITAGAVVAAVLDVGGLIALARRRGASSPATQATT